MNCHPDPKMDLQKAPNFCKMFLLGLVCLICSLNQIAETRSPIAIPPQLIMNFNNQQPIGDITNYNQMVSKSMINNNTHYQQQINLTPTNNWVPMNTQRNDGPSNQSIFGLVNSNQTIMKIGEVQPKQNNVRSDKPMSGAKSNSRRPVRSPKPCELAAAAAMKPLVAGDVDLQSLASDPRLSLASAKESALVALADEAESNDEDDEGYDEPEETIPETTKQSPHIGASEMVSQLASQETNTEGPLVVGFPSHGKFNMARSQTGFLVEGPTNQIEEAPMNYQQNEAESSGAAEEDEADAMNQAALAEQQQQQKDIIKAQSENEARSMREQQEQLLRQQALQQEMLITAHQQSNQPNESINGAKRQIKAGPSSRKMRPFGGPRASKGDQNSPMEANQSQFRQMGSLVDRGQLRKQHNQQVAPEVVQFSDQPDRMIELNSGQLDKAHSMAEQMVVDEGSPMELEALAKSESLRVKPDLAFAAQHNYGAQYDSLKGHHQDYYMFAESHKKGQFHSGFKRGNKKHSISGHASQNKNKAEGHFMWHNKKGKGTHYWDYKHGHKKYGNGHEHYGGGSGYGMYR